MKTSTTRRVRKPMWDRTTLWGVLFTGSDTLDTPMLLGEAWHGRRSRWYPGEAARALLFTTRRAAEVWCRTQRAKYRGRQDNLRFWRFRPVRVREVVRIV